ncbi:MAG: Hsp20/alpha crystallin family protein [Thiohalomonadales bacterium]
MELQKLNPWNWFKHEHSIPVHKDIAAVKQGNFLKSACPLTDVHKLRNELFRGFGFPGEFSSLFPSMGIDDSFMQSFSANINVACDDKLYTITLEAPGMDQEDLSIDLKDRVLVVSGNKQQKTEEKDKHFYCIERHYGAFQRVLAIPDDADVESIRASMNRGILTITISRKETSDAQVKRIDIDHG